MFNEEDVNLLALTPDRFEEACFDLLLSLGFQGLSWRQGSADDGRDIEGRRTVESGLVGTYDESWLFECKRYEGGVPPEALNSKIAWADAEQPNHLAILTTSHLTNGAANWLEKLRPQKSYAIHVIDGKALRRLFSHHRELMARYFIDGPHKLLLDARRTWLVHSIIPEAETLKLIAEELDSSKLSASELAFLWCSAKLRNEDVERLIEDSEPFYFDHLFSELANMANTADPIITESLDVDVIRYEIGQCSWEQAWPTYDVAELVLEAHTKPRLALYSFITDTEGEGLEVLVERSGDFPVKTRHLETQARTAAQAAREVLNPRGHDDLS